MTVNVNKNCILAVEFSGAEPHSVRTCLWSVLVSKIPFVSWFTFALLILSMSYGSLSLTTATMFVVSIMMFLSCFASATHLLGLKAASQFTFISLVYGFFAEYMGENYGWFFGDYDFTDNLGLRIIGVPLVIPLMWFSLTYISYVLGNIILRRAPRESSRNFGEMFVLSFFGAILVTAYDLAADPYMVYVVKAWIMEKTDGWWFGETIQGFFGWWFVSFMMLITFRFLNRHAPRRTTAPYKKTHALIPISIYMLWMVFQMMYGYPMETRTISFFAMGIPLMVAFFTWNSWTWNESTGAA